MRGVLRLAVGLSFAIGCTCGVNPEPDGGTPALAFTEGASYDFGAVDVGATAEHAFTLSNSGAATADTLILSVTGPFTVKAGSTCSASLAPGMSCAVTLVAAPASLGLASGMLTARFVGGSHALSLSVTGVQQGPAVLMLTDAPAYDFGAVDVGQSPSHTFMLTNSGSQPAMGVAAMTAAPFAVGTSTCGATLAGGATCALPVTFSPTAGGAASGMLTVTYTDAMGMRSVAVSLQGSGRTPAVLTLSEGPGTYDFGGVAVSGSASHTFDLINSGNAPATQLMGMALAAPFSFTGGGAFPGSGGDCGTTLAAGATCHVAVTFAPTAGGAASATLTVGYHDGMMAQQATRPLSGSGSAPALLVLSDGPTYDFGNRGVLGAADHLFTVTNTSAVDATMLAPGMALTGPFDFKGGAYPGGTGATWCGTRLPALQSCTVAVTYWPMATGTTTTTLRLSYFNGVATQTVSRTLTGTGTDKAFLSISDGPTWDWGTRAVNAMVDHTFTVTNTGGADASSVSVAMPAAPFVLKTNGCGASLLKGDSCTLVVTFAPTAPGTSNGTLTLTYNDSAASVMAVRALRGTATNRAFLTIAEAPEYAFGPRPIGSATERAFTVKNEGAVAASGLNVPALMAPFAVKPGTTCTGSLAVQATCTVTVVFSPTMAAAATGTLTVAYNDGGSQQQATVALSATGVPPATLVISDGPSFDFGQVAVNGSAEHLFYVTNSGAVTATGIAGSALAAPYRFRGGTAYPGFGGSCGATLGAGSSCTIAVVFAPTTAAAAPGSLSLGYFDGVAMRTSARALAGTGTTHPVLAITDWPPAYYSTYGLPPDSATFSFGVTGLSTTLEHTFYVTNVGGSDATQLSGAALTPAAFAFRGGGAAPGQGGTCGGSLAPGATCTVVATFTPTAAPAVTSSLALTYDDMGTMRTASRPLSGSGTSAALLEVQDFPGIVLGTAVDFGTLGVGGSLDRKLYVVNSGRAPATQLAGTAFSPGFAWKGGTFPGAGGSCGSTLAAGLACTVVVSFAPTVAGPLSDLARVTYHDGTAMQSASRAVRGSGTFEALLLMKVVNNDGGGGPPLPSYAFGPHGVMSATDVTLDITNIGAGAATMMTAGSAAVPFSVKSSTCGATLPAGANCQLTVTFRPVTGGDFFGAFTLDYFDGAATRTLVEGLSGTGVSNALLVVASDDDEGDSRVEPFDFGTSGVPVTRTFTVTNVGAVAATSLSFPAPPAPFSNSMNGCGMSLAAGAQCTLTVTFSPTSAGSFSGAVRVTYHDGASAQSASRAVTGTGTTDALLVVDTCDTNCGSGRDEGYDFGTQGTPRTVTFWVKNVGAVGATALAFSGLSAPFSISQNTCGTSVASGGRCSLTITFTPATAGYVTQTLAVGYSGTAGMRPPATLAVFGTATTEAVLVLADCPNGCGGGSSNQPFDFGVSGVATTHVFGVFNTGPKDATAVSIGGLSAPFSLSSSTCGATVAKGSACSVTVAFDPAAAGTFSSTLTVSYQSSGLAQPFARRALVGTGVTGAHLDVIACANCGESSPPQPFIFPVTGVSLSDTRDFWLVNRGAQPATAIAMTGVSAPFDLPAAQNECGATLASGQSCHFTVRFAPGMGGAFAQLLSVAYSDSSGAQPAAARELRGTGTSSALLRITECNTCQVDGNEQERTVDFGTLGQPGTRQLWVINRGGSAATAVGFGTLAAPFSISQNTCGATLAVGAACSFTVRFTPSGSASSSASLSVAYSDTAGAKPPTTVSLSGRSTDRALLGVTDCTNCGGGDPQFPSPIDFGLAGLPTPHTVYVFNSGAQAATMVAVSGPSGAFSITSNTCGTSLAAGAFCAVMLTFTPTGAGVLNGTLNVDYHDGVQTAPRVTRTLVGTATDRAVLSLTDCETCTGEGGTGGGLPTFDLGTLGQPFTKALTLRNTGARATTSLSIGALAAPFAVSNNACPATLASGASCSFSVTFTPSGNGPQGSTVTVSYADALGARPDAQARFSAVATNRALLFTGECQGCGGGTTDFGTTGVPLTRTLMVFNGGAITATGVSIGGVTGAFSIASNGCGSTLAVGASCQVSLTFTPSGTAVSNGSLDVSYGDAMGALPTVSRPLIGTGTDRALLAILDCDGCGGSGGNYPYDFGTTGTPASRTFTITNTGAVTATGVSVGGLAAPFSVTANGCTTSLARGTSCTVTVTFTPSGAITSSTTLAIGYHDGTSTTSATRGLSGTSTNRALLSVSDCQGGCGGGGQGGGPSTTDFGTSGLPVTRQLYVVNSGSIPTTALTVTPSGTGFSVSNNGCTAVLAAGASCAFTVTFTPTGNGPLTGRVDLAYSDAAGARPGLTKPLAGTATNRALLSISDCSGCGGGGGSGPPPPFDFGTRGQPASQTFSVHNSGAVATTSLSAGGLSAPFSVTGTSCGAALAPGASCDVTVTFTPSGSSSASGTLSLSYGDATGALPALGRALQGTSTDRALLRLTECPNCGGNDNGQTDWGLSGIPVTRTVSLVNSGALAANAPTLSGLSSTAFSVTGNGCTAPIAPGMSCTLQLTFTPTGSGPLSATLAVDYTDAMGARPQLTRRLTGTATNRALLQLSDCSGCGGGGGGGGGYQPPPYDFGLNGRPAQNTFSVRNVGGAAAMMVSVSGLSAPYSASGCGGTLAPGASCQLTVTFTPTADGVFNATLSIAYQDVTGALAPVTRELTAAGTTRALLIISDGCCGGGGGGPGGPPPYDFGTWGVPITHRFQVINIGAISTTAVSYALLAPFSSSTAVSNGCTSTIAPGAPPCEVEVTFTPSGSSAAQQTLSITANDLLGTRPAVTRAVMGTPTTAPRVLILDDFMGTPQPGQQGPPGATPFGTQGQPSSRRFNVFNVGGAPVTDLAMGAAPGTAFSYLGGFPGTGSTPPCGATLAASASVSCQVTLTFTPPAMSSATFNGAVDLSWAGQHTVKPVNATATPRAMVTIDPFGCGEQCGPYDFGGVTVGMSTQRVLTLSNTGALAANPLSFGALGTPFSILSNDCNGNLATNSTCTVTIRFQPTGTGDANAQLMVNYNDTLITPALSTFRSLRGTGQ